MEPNIFLLKGNQGKKTLLDKAFFNHINSVLRNLDEEEEARWETYSVIFQELISGGNSDFYDEIKYRLTDGENPNIVILDIIERGSNDVNNVVWFFKKRIEEYIEEDYFKKFFN